MRSKSFLFYYNSRVVLLLIALFCTPLIADVSVDNIQIIPRHVFDEAGYSGDVAVSKYDGRVHVVWANNGKIKYSIRNNDGTWTEPENIDVGNLNVVAIEYNAGNLPRARKCIDIFVDKNDITHMVFSEEHGNVYYLTGSKGNWSSPELIAQKGHISIYPEIVVLDDNVYIAFEDGEAHEIFYISRINGIWQPLRNMGPGMLPTLKIGSTGMVYLLYRFWDGKDLQYNAVFAYMVPYFTDWTFMGEIYNDTTNPLPEITHVERRLEHGPNMAVGIDGYIYMAWPHRTPNVDSPSPYKCQLFCARAKEPGFVWDVKYGKDTQLFYQDTGSPYPRVEVYSDSTILYYNSRRIGPYFLINRNGTWSNKRTASQSDLWSMGISQVANDGRTIWVMSSTWGDVKGSVDITGLTNPEAFQFDCSDNDPVINTNPDTIAVVGQKWTYSCRAADADEDNLTYSLVLSPDSMKINKYSGDVEWNVTNDSDPITLIGIKVDDDRGGYATQYFRIRVSPPDAGFTAEPRSGYAPLYVQFTDISGGKVEHWLWNFGDDSTSTEQNPRHRYSHSGTYSVSLKVTSESGSSTTEKSSYITVFTPPPFADFSAAPVSGLKPLEVFFTDKSMGDITSYKWVFGDGSSSDEQNPTHIYQSSGVYSVSLTVKGAGGSNTKTIEGYISVAEEAPTADFMFYPDKGEAPLTITFTDKSSGIITNYLWDFGDNNTSFERNPEYTYDSTGVYSVSLTVTGPGGNNKKTVDSAVVVTPPLPVPDFKADTTIGLVPFTALFENKTTGVTDSLTWDFGDGGKSSDPSPSHMYESVCYYTVRLTAWLAGQGKTKTKENYITVLPSLPYADFKADTLKGFWPLNVQFTDLSVGDITNWQWRFGNGIYSSEQNPLYVYNKTGDYTVTLIVMGPSGIDSLVKRNYINVFDPSPKASFKCDTTKGDKPFAVHFIDKSEGPVTSWNWNFGDGGYSTEQNPVHTYTEEGIYSVKLKVTGPGGKDSTSVEGLINVTVDALVYEENRKNPQNYILYQNFPNPFNNETVISFYLPEQSFVEISIFDVRGNRISVLKKDVCREGINRITWKGVDDKGIEVPTGIYVIQMKTEANVLRQKSAFIK